jgi:type IV secretory pathway TrbL component
MKSTLILLSLVVAVGMWAWRRTAQKPDSLLQHWRLVGKCLLAGLVTYFSLAILGLIYLTITSA